jgi:hypothetical protein
MKTEELKLENLVMIDNELLLETKGEIFIITGIQRRSQNDFPDSDSVISLIPLKRSWRNYSQFNEFIRPIPLTEEWLKKFGFEGKINNISLCGNFYLGYDPEYHRHKMALWYQKGSWCFSHTEQFTVLKYVHQLQNLYFALCGQELEIINNS